VRLKFSLTFKFQLENVSVIQIVIHIQFNTVVQLTIAMSMWMWINQIHWRWMWFNHIHWLSQSEWVRLLLLINIIIMSWLSCS